jgi:hypothetical protein
MAALRLLELSSIHRLTVMMQARNDLGVHEPLYSIDELVNRLSKK